MIEINSNLHFATGGFKGGADESAMSRQEYSRLTKTGGYPEFSTDSGNYITFIDARSGTQAVIGAAISAAQMNVLGLVGAAFSLAFGMTVKNREEERHRELQEAYKGFDNPDNYG